jgi:hypothetical protein
MAGATTRAAGRDLRPRRGHQRHAGVFGGSSASVAVQAWCSRPGITTS